jgi:hypothetical protein
MIWKRKKGTGNGVALSIMGIAHQRQFATRDTSLHLVYEADAVLPPEIFLEPARVTQFNEADQDEARELDS